MIISTTTQRVAGLRAPERDRIADLIEAGARLVTITGLGGIGKSTLAGDVVDVLGERHPDLAISALIVGAHEGAGLRSRLVDELGGATELLTAADATPDVPADPHLVVIDGGEHLLDNTADLRELLEITPGLQLLVTSRVALNLPEETVVALRGLDTAADGDAMRLFLSLAKERGSRIPREQLPRVRDIVVRLGGYPLAIRLCAAQLQDQSLSAVHQAIVAPQSAGGGADVDPDLRRVIVWSLDRQSANAVRLLRLLTVFRGWASIDSIEAVAAAVDAQPGRSSRQVVGRTMWLAELTEAGLVDRESTALPIDGGMRYRVHDSIREVARDYVVSQGEPLDLLAAAHQRWYTEQAGALAADTTTRRELRAFGQLQAELPEYTAALDALIDTDPTAALDIVNRFGEFWVTRGRIRTGVRLLRSALRAVGDDPDGYGDGPLARVLGQSWVAHMKLREGAPLASETYRSWLADTLAPVLDGSEPALPEHFALAVHYIFLSMVMRIYPPAMRVGTRCRDLAVEAGDDYHAGLFSFYLSRVAEQADDLEETAAHIRRAIVHVRRTGNESFLAKCISQEVLMRESRMSSAELVAELTPIIEMHRRNGSFKDAALISIPVAIAQSLSGQSAASLTLLRETLAMSRSIHYFDGQLYAVILIAFADLSPESTPDNVMQCARLYGGFRPYLARFAAITANRYRQMLDGAIGSLRELFGVRGLEEIAARSPASWPAVMAEADAFAVTLLESLSASAPAVPMDPAQRVAAVEEQLSGREREQLSLVLTGISDKLIAERLGLKPNTVRTYNSRIFRKFGVVSRAELLALFRAGGR